jgi:hypothetical protein
MICLLAAFSFASGNSEDQDHSQDESLSPQTANALSKSGKATNEPPEEYSPDQLVLPSPDVYRIIKSNPKHFVSFFDKRAPELLKQISNANPSFENLLTYKGLVFEDSHTFNFGDVHFPGPEKDSNGVSLFGPIDFDDFRSEGPLLESLLKKMTTDKAYDVDVVKLKDVYSNYVQGLEDALYDKVKSSDSWPNAVVEAVKLPFPKVLQQMSNYAMNRVLPNSKKLDNKKAEIKPIKDSDPKVKKEYEVSKNFFAQAMGGYVIHDKGYGTRKSGSSRDMMRFLFLVSPAYSPKDLYLFEFKQKAPSAAAELFPNHQPDPITVFDEIKAVYFDNKVNPEYLDVLKSPTNIFYEKRMRGNNRIAIKKNNFIEISYFQAYWEGLMAARQNPSYAEAFLEANKNNFYKRFVKPLAIEYLDTLAKDIQDSQNKP